MSKGIAAQIRDEAAKMANSRYFQFDKGPVVRGERVWYDGQPPTGEDWTEVQVVSADAIVIRRDELPEVTVGPYGQYKVPGHEFEPDTTPEEADAYARAAAALAVYLRAHPPVDEAQVKALTDALAFAHDANLLSSAGVEHVARQLVERGVRVETP